MNNRKGKIDNSLIGAAGVHFVVSELSLRGLIALPTIRNTAGVDAVVVSADGSWHANIQVKTSRYKVNFWPVSKRYEELRGKNNFYVFVRYLKNESCFEAFLETADRVAEEVKRTLEYFRSRGYAEWAPCWYLPKTKEDCERVRKQWLEFGKVYIP
jgi:hypothetical protein